MKMARGSGRSGSTRRPVGAWCRSSVVAAIAIGGGLAMAGCFGEGPVVRVVDGQQVEGRYVSAEAYDAFVRGTIAEADGDLEVAAAWYARAWEFDPQGADPLARLGGVLCAQTPSRRDEAEKVLARALRIDPGSSAVRVQRARCFLVWREWGAAEREARAAMVLGPDDGEATAMLAEVLLASGKGEDAARVLDGWVLWTGGARGAWRAVERLAARRSDEARLRKARANLGPMFPLGDAAPGVGGRADTLRAIDQAIARGDTSGARSLAVQARLRSSTVAVRACAMARWADAEDAARLVLAADPDDLDAAAVLLALPGSHAVVTSAAGHARAERAASAGLSPLAALIVADALRRRTGLDASQAFLDAYGDLGDLASDPLAAALQRRASSPR